MLTLFQVTVCEEVSDRKRWNWMIKYSGNSNSTLNYIFCETRRVAKSSIDYCPHLFQSNSQTSSVMTKDSIGKV